MPRRKKRLLDNITKRTTAFSDFLSPNMFTIDSRLIPKRKKDGTRRKGERKTYKRSSVLGRKGKSGFWSWFV